MVEISQGSLMVIFCALAASLSGEGEGDGDEGMMEVDWWGRRTVCAVLECFDFDASTAVATTVFGVLANVFP